MNRMATLAVIVTACFAVIGSAQGPQLAPFFENFEAEPTCGVGFNQACPLVGLFYNSTAPEDSLEWTVDVGGTGSLGTGPSVDHTTGTATGKYLYTETSGGAAGIFALLNSPLFDITSAANPQIGFWYHMYATDTGMGTMHVDMKQQINAGNDGVTVPGATNGTFVAGSSLFTAGAPGDTITVSGSTMNDGVYTIVTVIDDFTLEVTPNFVSSEGPISYQHDRLIQDITPAFTDTQDLWQKKNVPIAPALVPYGNGFTFQIIIRGVRGLNFTSDMAVDDFEFIDAQSDDIGVVSIDAPGSDICIGNYNVTATISNFGTNPQSNVPVSLLVNGGLVVTDVIAGPIPGGQTIQHTFSISGNFVAGPNSIDVITSLTGDLVAANDILSGVVNATAVINTFPYSENFEGGSAGWAVGGTTTFALGTPANAVINAAASGTNAWVTNLTGIYNANEQGFIRSPCFDFSGLSNPWVSLSVWWESEFSWDGTNLQYSVDGGLTWANVGAFGDQGNWYTDNTLNGNPGGSMEGWTGRTLSGNGSGGWVTAQHSMLFLAGAPSVEFRLTFGSDGSVQDEGIAIDDFMIFQPIVPFPGSGEDLTLSTGVNGAEDNSLGSETKQVNIGDALTIRTDSPMGTYTNAPYALLADLFATAGPLPAPISPINFPEVHISATVVVVLDGHNTASGAGLNWVVAPAGGSTLNFSVLDPLLSGNSVLLQSLSISNMAANGFFAITDGRVFEVQ
ncbi:MAG: hypothetical protein R3F20_03775 [Planctomycetota bacterium]